MKMKYKILLGICIILALVYGLSFRKIPQKITYGASFSKFHSDELGLDWRKVLISLLDDLEIKNFRLVAHWPMIEPSENHFNFSEMDFQMEQTLAHNASVILAVGRRLPEWPECHEPDWAKNKSQEEKDQKILEYISAVVNRYKNYKNIKYWQVENEPYLAFFSKPACGQLDEGFLQKEIDLVHKLDPKHPVLITASGEFDPWLSAYKKSDVFGSSMYLYVWWKIGPVRYPILPGFFSLKQNLVEWIYGKKPKILIELSTEPWLRVPITSTSTDILLTRMGLDKVDEVLSFASKTGFDTQYLWGAEWWYWMKEKRNHPEFWLKAKGIFSKQ